MNKTINFELLLPPSLPIAIRTSPTGEGVLAKAFPPWGKRAWEDGKNHNLPQDFADMLGWKEMADKSLAAYRMIPENELKNTLVICNNYGQAGALS